MRCEICRAWLATWKKLFFHLSEHSKSTLVREIMKLSSKIAVPITKAKRLKMTVNKRSQTIFANDKVQILCRDNDIIIRDDKSFVDMEFSFDDEDNVSEKIQENNTVEEINNNQSKVSSELRKLLTFNSEKASATKLAVTSSSSASSEDCFKQFSFKKRIRRKRDTRNYKINITRSNNYFHSLNENTGKFYLCHCREDNLKVIEDIFSDIKLASDTESASETGRSLTAFCANCGNGYETEDLLLEHIIKIHKIYCRVCNKIFHTEELYKEHIETHSLKVFVCHICNNEFPDKSLLNKHFETHVEDSVLESVLDMEEDYEVVPQNVPDEDYQNNITNILSYLRDNRDMYNNTHKVYCNVCFTEVFYDEYENHVQNMHRIYGFDN